MEEAKESEAPAEEQVTTPEATKESAPTPEESKPVEGEAKPEGTEGTEKPSEEPSAKDEEAQTEEFVVGTHKFTSTDELLKFAKTNYGRLGGAVGALKATYPDLKGTEIENVLETGQLPQKSDDGGGGDKAVAKLVELGYTEKDATALVTSQRIILAEENVVRRGSPELDPDLVQFKKKASAFIKSTPEAANVADVMDIIFHTNYAKGHLLEPDEIYSRAKVAIGGVSSAPSEKSDEDKKTEEAKRNQAVGMSSGDSSGPSTDGSKVSLGNQILKSARII